MSNAPKNPASHTLTIREGRRIVRREFFANQGAAFARSDELQSQGFGVEYDAPNAMKRGW